MFAGLLAGIATAYCFINPFSLSIVCLISSFLALNIAFKIHFTLPPKTLRSSLKGMLAAFRDIIGKPSLLFSALGEDFFFAMGGLLPILLMFSVKKYLGSQDILLTATVIQSEPLIGFAFGALLAGRLSSKKIELGLVPFGALGVALSLILASHCIGPVIPVRLVIPGLGTLNGVLPIGAGIFLLLAGICSGLFVIPLRTYFQHRVHAEVRSTALAINHAFAFLMLLIFSMIVCRFLPLHDVTPTIPAWTPTFEPENIVMVLGCIMFIVTLITMCALPNFMLRFLIISLGNTVYKLKITGAEKIPQQGPVMLVSNHVSFVDNILLSACTSRNIRFLMQENVLKSSFWLRSLARLTKFILVPGAGKIKSIKNMFEEVQTALRNGDIICVFPEGLPTRNGLLGEFHGGFLKMLPPDMPDIPIIPVHIGDMWGSSFSYFSRIVKYPILLRLHHTARITFGDPMKHDVTPFEVRQKIAELSADTAINTARPNEYPLHVRLAYNMKKMPFHTLFRDADGKSFPVYKIFLAALLMSREFRKLYKKDEELVGVMMPNCSVAAMALLGVLYSDKVPCPLNFTTPRPVLEETLKKAGIKHIITSHKFLAKINYPESEGMIFLEDMMPLIPGWKKIAFLLCIFLIPTKELMNIFSPLTNSDVFRTATVLFSSGSTGKPKGIVLSHHNINGDMYPLVGMVAPDPKDSGFLGNLPLFHSFGMNVCFWIPISTGVPITYITSPLDAALTGKLIERDKLTMIFATPSFLQAYLRKCKPEQFASVRFLCTGAEKLRTDIKERFSNFVGGRLQIIEGYGCTELAPVATLNVSKDFSDIGKTPGKTGAIGPAVQDVAIKVVDPITFKELPPNSEGLMFVRGPMMMQGYLNQPADTEKALIDGYYNTGDIITMDECGYVTICGRLSRFSKIAGEMVPHEMVECIINELCKTEARVVAVGSIPDAQKGEALLVLYTPEMPLTPDQVVAELRERSISNLWIPKAVNFYPVDQLPVLGTGKLDLSQLRKIADKVAKERAEAAAQKEAAEK